MSTQPVEIHLQLAALARTTSAPVGYIQWTRAQRRRAWGWEYLERLQIVGRSAATRLRSAPRPTWPTLLAAALAASLLVWWVMRERMPAIDPHALIATHLTAADAAVADERYLEPFERSALHHYRTVLALDPANAQARSGLASLAETFVENARSSILDRRLADAVIALDGLRRVAPDHRRLALLETQLRRAVDEQATIRSAAVQNAKMAQQPAPAGAARVDRARDADVDRARDADAPVARVVQDRAPPPAAEAARKPEKRLVAALPPLPPIATSPSNAAPAAGAASAPTPAAEPLAQAVSPNAEAAATPPESAGSAATPTAEAPARKLVRYVAPDYPREALMRGIEGWVDLDLTINSAGDVIASNVVGGKARQVFDRAAAGAVRRWKYEARDGGDPFQALQVRVTFELEE